MPETNESTTLPTIPPYPPDLKSRGRGRRLWRELHRSADFQSCPETMLIAEEACYLADEIERQRGIIRAAGDNTRVIGSQKQPVSMPEIADLQRNQGILLGLLKSMRLPAEDGGDGKLTRSQVGQIAASARWNH